MKHKADMDIDFPTPLII